MFRSLFPIDQQPTNGDTVTVHNDVSVST